MYSETELINKVTPPVDDNAFVAAHLKTSGRPKRIQPGYRVEPPEPAGHQR